MNGGTPPDLIAVRPHRWYAEMTGNGPDLLLIHGAGASAHSWAAMVPALARAFRVISIDLPGQGRSRLGARNRAGLGAMAADIAALIDNQGWHPQAIIGHSAGAALALELATILPDPPRAVVGINPALQNFKGAAGVLFPLIAKALALNPLTSFFLAGTAASPARVRRLIEGTGSHLSPPGLDAYLHLFRSRAHVDATLAMMAQWSLEGLSGKLPGLTVPVLFVTGENDQAVPPQTADQAAAAMPNARVIRLAGLGHLAHEEDPERVGALALSFLSEHGLGGPVPAGTV